MSRIFFHCCFFAILFATASMMGCRGEPAATTPNTAEEERIEAALAKLPPEDQQAARDQRICPVSEMPLGSMGAPPKVDVNGREVFICCESCREALLESPDEHLAKLERQP